MLVTMAIIGLQVQERGIALVGFGDQVAAGAEARVGAGALQAAADDEGRIFAALGQHRWRRGWWWWSCRACRPPRSRSGSASARRASRRAAPPGCGASSAARHFRVVAPTRRSRSPPRRRSPTFSASWPIRTRAPSFARRSVTALGLRSRALHFVAEVQQHFGDAAHAAAADADEVDAMDAAHAIAHAAASMRARDPFLQADGAPAPRPRAASRPGARARPSRAACRGPRTAPAAPRRAAPA